MNKIFQIGFNKCGTLSFHELFDLYSNLQQKAIHWDYGRVALSIRENLFNNKPLLNNYEQYTVFTDMECCYKKNDTCYWLFAYKWFYLLDKQYPNSKFILNTRNVENWIQSRINHYCGMMLINNEVSRLKPVESYINNQQKYYGTESLEELIQLWKDDWYEHHLDVISYFKNRPQDLLVYHIEKDPFSKIVDFFKPYGIIFNTDGLPQANKTQDRHLTKPILYDRIGGTQEYLE